MIYVHWLIITVYVLAVVGTVARVLLDNRQPAKTMAWVMVLFFVPVVGIILYFFFGQNTRKERLISQQSLNQLAKRSMFEYEEQADLQVPEEYRALLSVKNDFLGCSLRKNRSVLGICDDAVSFLKFSLKTLDLVLDID